MKLTNDDLENMAQLARLGLEEVGSKNFINQLDDILGYVDNISKINTNSNKFHHMSGLINVLKKDVIGQSLEINETLKNSPVKQDSYIKVKAVFAK